MNSEWSIQQIAKLAGTTSRTLRHYGELGLLAPSRIGSNGYRYYDERALVRLQRILLLRDLGLGLPQIADILERATSEAHALAGHLAWLREEQTRLARQIASVESTIAAVEGGERLMAENMFDGFDHTRYKEEVEQRWGEKAYADSDRWWRSMSADEKAAWQRRVSDLSRDWIAAAERGIDPAGDEAQQLAERHVAWLTGVAGTPASIADGDVKGYVTGLGDMYVADPRFGANYGGTAGAEFVRDALRAYADTHL
ncbi:MerR family transcriptional regulator [Microbacterium invictum]|uniref:DNA-binding transcriptional MerR regulator n=1 Tax=Microbacterium invictum TaxID=515415 RepID=A0AA40VN49_9MICO|nr:MULTISPECIES: MerR family transcriptional regulator [Microbacterium]MBB4140449.1 DNA-binding transcriptional MerR regulator [Microbacterium invictum]